MLQAGKLNKRVDIERNEGTADGLGEIVASFVALYQNIPASIEPLQGREFYAARQFNAEVTHKVTLRYEYRDIKPADRVSYLDPVQGTRTFNIEVVRNIEEGGHYFELLCTEQVGRDAN